MDDALRAVKRMPPAWLDFFIMAGVFALVAIGALIWGFYYRKKRRRRHKHRHQSELRSDNPTLAQTGGLPPPRPPPPGGTPSQTP
ncbi:MAG: hypothetical protein ABSA45_02535 [Verrucomicrobiota bacterium]|jgi:hypothetical protein